MTNTEAKFNHKPKGLLILGGLQLFVAFRGIWNFSFHINESILHVSIAILCGIIGVGIMNIKRWAYPAFIAVCAILFLWNVGDAITGKDLIKSLQRVAVSMTYVGWLFIYRRYFRNSRLDKVTAGYTKEEAANVAVDNSYYFIVAGCIPLVIAIFALFGKSVPGLTISYLIIMATLYLSMALALRKLKSRVASILLLTVVVWALLPRLTKFDLGWSFIFNLLFLAAAVRSVKATFIFHR